MPAARHPEPIVGKVMILVTEDWFALSHFKPLISLCRRIAGDVVVVTRSSGRKNEIEALGARAMDFEYNRSSLNPAREARTAAELARLMRAEKPDVVHMIAMKPIVLGCMAVRMARVPHAVVHMTGLGFLAISQSWKTRVARRIAMGIIGGVVRRPSSWLFCENADDLAFLESGGARAGGRVTILGGAGVDLDAFPAHPPPGNVPPVAAFVGRMILPKGVDTLMEAGRLLARRGVAVRIELYGHSDEGNPEAIPEATLEQWGREGLGQWLGPTSDVASVWKRADISVLPARSREGMPRALLEAAASARPLVVTDVPGCRHFVRHDVEGLVVPPGDARALSEALERLTRDPALRARLGAAARARFLEGFTTEHVVADLEDAYRKMLFAGA
jgi:glycosyltransferase involved in cell wall biosynthesis